MPSTQLPPQMEEEEEEKEETDLKTPARLDAGEGEEDDRGEVVNRASTCLSIQRSVESVMESQESYDKMLFIGGWPPAELKFELSSCHTRLKEQSHNTALT